MPISGPTALADHAPVEFEGENVHDARSSLENDLEMYGTIIESVRGHVSLAEDLGDFATGEMLREYLEDLEEDAHEIDHFLEDAYKRVRAINDDLAIRIVELGGIPPNTPPTIQEHAEVHLEAEDLYDLRPSLEGDLEGYATLVASMREHVRLVEDLGDSATGELLREHLETLEDDATVLDHYLEDDTLVRRDALR